MKDKRVWLIGASEGIGSALAFELANRGARLTLSARTAARLEDVLARLPGTGHAAHPLDVCALREIETVWAKLCHDLPDVVIYNAGAYTPMDAQHLDIQQVETMIDVNLRGAFRLAATVLPHYVARRSGHLVLVGSVAGYRGLPSAMGYGASKAGLNHLAENLRIDLRGSGIKVQLVSPGFVKTRLTDKNTFEMPFMVSPQDAALRIADGLMSDSFEIHFPRRFSYAVKLLGLLPHWLYFSLISGVRRAS